MGFFRHVLFPGLLALSRVGAHPELTSAVWIEAKQGEIRLVVEASVEEILQAQREIFANSHDFRAFEAAAVLHSGLIRDRFRLAADSRLLKGKLVEKRPPLSVVKEEVPDHHHSYVFTFSFPVKEMPGTLSLEFLKSADPNNPASIAEFSHVVGFSQGDGAPLIQKAIKPGEKIGFYPVPVEPSAVDVPSDSEIEPVEPEAIASLAPAGGAGRETPAVRVEGKQSLAEDSTAQGRSGIVILILGVLCAAVVLCGFLFWKQR
jgi:hypothetical protein